MSGRLSLAALAVCTSASAAETPVRLASATAPEQITVLAKRPGKHQNDDAASEGVVRRVQIQQRPVYRVGEILETVPGLIVTQHSGEGKANQYFLRGFNLDHGTDINITVDDMPVNMRTHGHGQGYSDVAFVIPELIGGITYRKGTYSAVEGDFSAAGAVHTTLVNDLPDQVAVSAGTLGDYRLFGSVTRQVGPGTALFAGEYSHLDGPWKIPDDFNKVNLFARYFQGTEEEKFSLTGMFLNDEFHATNQIPQRAVEQGLLDRFGAIDPTDEGATRRWSVSGKYQKQTGPGTLTANAYIIGYDFTLFNDFTYFLDFPPPIGDQFKQTDNRMIYGGSINYSLPSTLFGAESIWSAGLQTRYDDIKVGLFRTTRTVTRFTVRQDYVDEFSSGAYVENRTEWAPWFRSVLGVRGDVFWGHDKAGFAQNSGEIAAFQPSPKLNLIFGPWEKTEFFASAGRGFHSNDVRGALANVNALATLLNQQQGNDTIVKQRPVPLITSAVGAEVGVRTRIIPDLELSLALFQLDLDSELTFSGDGGDTSAGRPSQRRGVELTSFWQPTPWLTVAGNFAYNHARYTSPDTGEADAVAGHSGNYIPGSPELISSVGVTVSDLGRWSGGLEWRYFGPRPLTEDNFYHSNPTQLVNLRLGYRVLPGTTLQCDIFNLFDSKAHQIDYAYASLLPSDNPARINPEEGGVDDIHFHPVEPLSARFTIRTVF